MAALISAALALPRSALTPFASPARFRKPVPLPFKCRAGPSPPQVDTEGEEKAAPLWDIPTSTWRAGFGAVGLIETGYLTYSKLTNSEAFCPVGSGGSCGDVLNSDYSYVFGLPLPLIGMVAYGLVVLLAFRAAGRNVLSALGETDARLILLGTTTSMATASAYFLYILVTKFAGTSCTYCLISAILSFSLFFLTIKDFGLEEIRKGLGLQLAIAGIVVTVLSTSYTTASPQLSGSSDIELDIFETEITRESSTFAVSLAKHLHSIGAKMYGAFWCSHCNEQKEMFGREAAKILDYVECFPDGVGKGRKIAKECTAAGIQGFPTWIIKDQVLSGEQELKDLAQASGFVLESSQQELKDLAPVSRSALEESHPS